MQDELMKQYNQKYTCRRAEETVKPGVKYVAPEGYDEHLEHFTNFFDGVRDNKPLVEGPEFAFRAAAPHWPATTAISRRR